MTAPAASEPSITKKQSLDPAAYLRVAIAEKAKKNFVLAHALYRSAEYLGGGGVEATDLDATRLTDQQLMGRGSLYQRNRTASDLIFSNFPKKDMSIVDVGGSTGIMSHMLTGAKYMLCEPSVNCLFSNDLIISGHKFDLCLSVHVFEHISDEKKEEFFESLLELGRDGVVLCNPVEGGDNLELHQFLLDTYGPLEWITDHMRAGIPTLDVFRDLASKYSLDLQIHPCGNRFISMALFAMQHFASQVDDPEALKRNGRLTRYINARYKDQNSTTFPRDYVLIFKRKPKRWWSAFR